MSKAFVPGTFDNDGGLLTYRDNSGTLHCLGNLIYFAEHGVYDADLGRVDVDPALVEKHNEVFNEMLLKGLDERCEVGQGGSFYFHTADDEKGRRFQVRTFNGKVVSEDVVVNNRVATFRRAGKTYRGRLSKNHDLLNFRRVA